MKNRGFFITLEGGEGSGKSTQINLLAEFLKDKGFDVITTREPGGTPEAEKVRELLVDRDGGNWTPMAEALLFFTARNMHVEDLIKPALSEGKIVICDRFTDSTRAYQCYGHGVLSIESIERLNQIAIDDFSPDLTLILDIPVETGLKRSGVRLDNENSKEDRFENFEIEFHQRLRQGYLEIAEKNSKRCKVVNADQSIKVLSEQINSLVLEKIG
jgi:dTMP kinase